MVQALSWARLLTRSHFLPLIAVHDGDGDGGIQRGDGVGFSDCFRGTMWLGRGLAAGRLNRLT